MSDINIPVFERFKGKWDTILDNFVTKNSSNIKIKNISILYIMGDKFSLKFYRTRETEDSSHA